MVDDQADQKAKLRGLKRALQAMQSKTSDNATLSLLQSFLTVCDNEGKGVVELSDIVGISRTTMSRHLLDLSESLRNGSDGYKLLIRTQDPSNMRSVAYVLSNKGKALRNQLIDLLE